MKTWRDLFKFGSIAVFGILTSATAGTGQMTIVPGAQADSAGNFDNSIPWSDEAPVRYQQVLRGSEVGTMEVVEIRFRQDESHGWAFAETLRGVKIVLSSTAAAPDALSMTFSENLGADATTVFAGNLSMTSLPDSSVPRGFDPRLRTEPWFSFDASTGLNLLIDVTIESGPELTYFDAEVSEADGVSRVYCWTVEECLTTDEAMIADTVGLITMVLGPVILEDDFETGETSRWSVAVR
jgi:hypothetical protein